MSKKTHFVAHKRSEKIIQRFVSLGLPFTMKVTSQTVVIETQKDRFFVGNNFSFKDLNFINIVKKEAERTGKIKTPFSPADIRYTHFSHLKSGRYENVAEIDLNKAYWNKAHELGYITAQTWAQGLEVDKITRLAALGAMATHKTTYRFDGKDFEKAGEKCNEITRSYFFHIAYEIDQSMYKAFHSCGVLFYWVDAFFVPIGKAPKLCSMLDSEGLDYSFDQLEYIEVDETSPGNYLIFAKLPGKEAKPYRYSTENKGIKALRSAERVIKGPGMEKLII